MVDLQPMETKVVEGPTSYLRRRTRGHPSASGIRKHPIADVPATELQVDHPEPDLTHQIPRRGGRDGPTSVGFGFPAFELTRDPRPRFLVGGQLARVPTLDIGLREGRTNLGNVQPRPRTQGEIG